MRVRIHRGAHEIGGSCVELEAEGQRIVLDVGRPLDALPGPVPLPGVSGFAELDPTLLGVVISHPHQDHWGLAADLPTWVPIYLGEAASRILGEAAFWTTGWTILPAGLLRHREPFTVGPFEITPFLNDHSAFDAYSLLIRAGDRSVFYSGDIRGHGRKSRIFEELLRKPPHDVDVFLMEGTNIRLDPQDEHATKTETDVENACLATFKATSGLCLVSFSAQNIDRLVTVYRAAKRAGRIMVIDLYTARIAAATGNSNIPRPGAEWEDVRVYVPQWQRVKVKDAGRYELVNAVRPYRLYEEDLTDHPDQYVVMCNIGSLQHFGSHGMLGGASFVYSLWPGYLKNGSGKKLTDVLAAHNIDLVIHHASGHASVVDLQRLATAIGPKRLVPIHTFGSARFGELFADVDPQPDGAWWDV